ncbi:hypothetical protein B0H13DRAFT_1626490 [Mycena leptocephala]|nr:hypothetical protein B0H13DRAFT_1626490 [Mycena leptocephala]
MPPNGVAKPIEAPHKPGDALETVATNKNDGGDLLHPEGGRTPHPALPEGALTPPATVGGTSSTGTVTGRVTCPVEAPKWFQLAFKEISREDVGVVYEEMLAAFVALKKSNSFVQGSGLPKAGRPVQVSDWIKDGRGRSLKVRPIDNLEKFESEWWSWWNSLQPPWRGTPETRTKTVEEGAEWGRLGSGGQNGVLSVVAALYWWAHAEKSQGLSLSGGLQQALADTTWVLQSMTKSS